MIQAQSFTSVARELGFTLWTGVPCSYLKPFINSVIDSPDLDYVGATNEGDAVAIAAGADLAGRRSIVMFQNSGFGNTVNPLTSINAIYKIPALVITTWRGEPGGPHDEPQHELMGQITPDLFDVMKIKWEFFPTEEKDVMPVLKRAVDHMDQTGLPYGLIMRKDSVESVKLKSKPMVQPVSEAPVMTFGAPLAADQRPSRRDVLSCVQKVCASYKDSTDKASTSEHSVSVPDVARATVPAVVATTGFTGRALYALNDLSNQLYMVGGMGCASSFALGFALAKPNTKTVCLDGDGAALMRLGAFATIGYERPKNLVHVLLDNEVHDSTGGQSTVSHSVDLAQVSHACGYPSVIKVNGVAAFEEAFTQALQSDQLTFIHIKTAPGESPDLPRPKVTPAEVAARMREYYKNI